MSDFDPRQGRRRDAAVDATCRGPDGQPLAAEITDVSAKGCRIAAEDGPVAGDAVVVRPLGMEALAGRVRWSHEKEVGVEFASALHPAVVDHLAGDDDLEGAPAVRRPSNGDFTDNFGRPLPALGSQRRRG